MIYAAYAHADIDDVAALIDMDSPTDAAALSTAVNHVEQWRAVVWTKAQNRLGVAPSTAAVIDHFEERRARLSASVRPAAWGSSASATSRRRVSRWRRRWGGRIANIRVREEVPLEDMRDKAGREPRCCRRRRRRRSSSFVVAPPHHPRCVPTSHVHQRHRRCAQVPYHFTHSRVSIHARFSGLNARPDSRRPLLSQ